MKKIALLAILPILIAGCNRNSNLDSPLVKIDNTTITSNDCLKRLNLEKSIYSYVKSSSNAKSSTNCCKFIERRRPMAMPELVNQHLIKEYLKSKNIVLPSNVVQTTVSSCLKKLKFKGSLSEFASKLEVDEEYLLDQLLAPTRVDFACMAFTNCTSVTEQEIDDGIARLVKVHDFAIVSNAVTYATATNVLKEIQNGKSFNEMALKYSQFDKEDGEYWQRLDATEITVPEMKKWAFSAPIGSVGGPWDMDDGLCIFKILERNDGPMEESLASELPVADVALARISFYMLVPDPEPCTREHVKEEYLKWKKNNAQRDLLSKLHREAKIEYLGK